LAHGQGTAFFDVGYFIQLNVGLKMRIATVTDIPTHYVWLDPGNHEFTFVITSETGVAFRGTLEVEFTPNLNAAPPGEIVLPGVSVKIKSYCL
jgi:hypothetical protein